MPIPPDLATLRLCSILTSTAFAVMFMAIWAGARRPSYLLHWAASAALYPIVLAGLSQANGQGAAFRLGMFVLLATTDMLILTGVRAFHGAPRYRAVERGVMTAAIIGPVLSVGIPMLAHISSEASFDLGMLVLGASKLAFGCLLALDGRAEVTRGQRLAGYTMLAYVPVFAIAIAAQRLGLEHLHPGATLPLLADQLLLAALNISLMSMRGERAHRSLKERSLRDPLTGIRNRAWLESYRTGTQSADAAVIIVDIDHFKRINDRYGHAAGDEVLMDFAARANELVEAELGMLARLGGDEFIAIVPDADSERAARIAHDLLNSLRSRSPASPMATASLGVAVGSAGEDLSGVMARADHCLYEAKAAGRDCVVAD